MDVTRLRERTRLADLRTSINKVSVEILTTDTDVGLTFVSIAETTEKRETRERNIDNARTAHDWVQRRRGVYVLTGTQNDSLDCLLRELKSRLEVLGQIF